MMAPTWLKFPWRRPRRGPAARTTFLESTLAEQAWERTRQAVARWARWGAVLGLLVALVLFAPAAWLASAVASATDQRLLLAEARGSIWSGSAVPVLTGGPGSRDAVALPARLAWTLRPSGLGLELRLRQACCIQGEMVLQWRPGLGQHELKLLAGNGAIGEWPAAWLAGLGTPWNTMQLGGSIRLSSPGLTLQAVQGRLRVQGQAEFELSGISSRVSTLDALGSYRLVLGGNMASGDAPTLNLSTLDGALRLSGDGQWAGGHLRFRGQAEAAAGFEGALNNLLNIIGRRQGALSVISIG